MTAARSCRQSCFCTSPRRRRWSPLAESEGIDTRRRHDLKADAAGELFRRGIVSDDLSEVLRSLNQVRKDATYEGEDPDLSAEDLEALAERIETIVVVAERRAG